MKVHAEKDAMIQAFARAVEQAGGKALLVGGIVRDQLLGLPSKDYDFEVFGLPLEQVQNILGRFGNVKQVGQSFGVLHIQELDWDIALPRRERKTGEGHRGFDVVPDPTMTIEEAARRRDLTINAMSKDPLTGEIIDPLGGLYDLQNRLLRAADPNTFGEDPLRALRVAQFAARFDFDVEPNTLQIVAAQPLEELPGERILAEFQKLLLKGRKPSKGIEILRQANLLRYFPEINALQGVPQDKIHHPEGDVYIHTMMVLDEAAAQRRGDAAFDLPLMLAALSHDFGKPAFTQNHGNGKVTAHGHEEGGEAPTRVFLNRMRAPNELVTQVATLVSTHLRPQLMAGRAGSSGYRRLARKLAAANISFDLLSSVSKADSLGRTTEKALRRDTSPQDLFMQEAHQYVLKDNPSGKMAPEDSVKGRDLIQRGFKPGPDMGKFLSITRAIEDETGIRDVDQLIDLATKFIKDKQGTENPEDPKNQCGDSFIRPGETCYDGKYDDMRKKGLTDSAQGPSEFRTNPDLHEPDYLLWHQFRSPFKDRNTVTHPGLATAEPAREHKRSLTFQPRWFDTGTPWSVRKENSRDGFGGSKPFDVQNHPPIIPKDEPHETSVTPATEGPGKPDKLPGFFPWTMPPSKILETDEPHPSPMKSNNQPGRFVRHPGGGGLDRAPMVFPPGKSPGGFLPVANPPDPDHPNHAGTDYSRGGQDPNPLVPMDRQNTGKKAGPGGGDDNSTEYWDMDRTGKKAGFLTMELPKENVYKSSAARSIDDLMDIDAIYPHDYNPEWKSGKPEMAPSIKHRNERHVAPDPIQSDDMVQKQVQPLMPNQKMAIALDPAGTPGNRIVIMSPLFADVSPAIQALKSQRFENHGAIVVDGPPMWLMGLEGVLQALDANSANDNINQLMQKLVDLLSQKGLTVIYTQIPGR